MTVACTGVLELRCSLVRFWVHWCGRACGPWKEWRPIPWAGQFYRWEGMRRSSLDLYLYLFIYLSILLSSSRNLAPWRLCPDSERPSRNLGSFCGSMHLPAPSDSKLLWEDVLSSVLHFLYRTFEHNSGRLAKCHTAESYLFLGMMTLQECIAFGPYWLLGLGLLVAMRARKPDWHNFVDTSYQYWFFLPWDA